MISRCPTPQTTVVAYAYTLAKMASTAHHHHAHSGITRNLDAAKTAYEANDTAASKAAHDGGCATEQHGGAGSDYVKSIVFGGLDGIITTFAVIAAGVGADLDIKVILLLGFSNMLSDGISMGFGDFLSSKAEMEHAQLELKRETWEFDNHPDGERQEMVDIYMQKGMSEKDAVRVIELLSKYKDTFLNLMMVQELGLMTPDDDDSPALHGLVTFASFCAFGSVPMWFYLAFHLADWTDDTAAMFTIVCVATGATMFALGAVKANFTKQNKLHSGLHMLGMGVLAAAAAYLVAWALGTAFSVDEHA